MASYSLNLIVTSEEPLRERAGGGATNRLLTYMADSECPVDTRQSYRDDEFFLALIMDNAGVEYIQILNNLGRERCRYDKGAPRRID
mgnify:CR=1 FL=1